MIDINKELIKASCDYFGEIDTATNATEECSELIQCVSKQIRGTENKSHMEEEIGDVLIAVSNLIYIYGLSDKAIQTWVNIKQNRQMNRIQRRGVMK